MAPGLTFNTDTSKLAAGFVGPIRNSDAGVIALEPNELVATSANWPCVRPIPTVSVADVPVLEPTAMVAGVPP